MNKRIKVFFYVSFLAIIGLGVGTSNWVEAGHLVIKGGTVYLETPCYEDEWTGVASKQILGEELERVGGVVAEIVEEIQAGKVYFQTVNLTETYFEGNLDHQSKARVTPGQEPLIYNVQALTTATGGTGEFEQATGRWSVRGELDLRCYRGSPGDPQNRTIWLDIKGGFIRGPYIP